MENYLLNGLTDIQIELFKMEYSFVMKHIPLKRRLNKDIKEVITKGLINLVKNNSGLYINDNYLDYIERVALKPYFIEPYGEVRDEPVNAYRRFLVFNQEDEQYRCLRNYLSYYDRHYDTLYDEAFRREKECIKNEYGGNVFSSARDLYNLCCLFKEEVPKVIKDKKDIELFKGIIEYLLMYFMINNNLYHDCHLYDQMCQYLLDNHDHFIDYYRLNFRIEDENPYYDRVYDYIRAAKNFVTFYKERSELENERIHGRPIY